MWIKMTRRIFAFFLMGCLLLTTVSPALAAQTEAALTIEYRVVSGNDVPGGMVAAPYTTQLQPGTEYSVESPVVEGYALADENQATVEGSLEKDTLITVLYESQAKQSEYTIRYVSSEDGKETLLKEVRGTAAVGSYVTAPNEVFPYYDVTPNQNISLQITDVPENNILTVKYHFYGHVHLVFDTGEGGSYISTITGKPGENISTLVAAIEPPARPGYKFIGWDWNPEDPEALPEEMPETDQTITALWEAGQSEYSVVYMMQDANDTDAYTPLDAEGIEKMNQLLAGIENESYNLKTRRTAQTGTMVGPAELDTIISEWDIEYQLDSQTYSTSPFFGFKYNGDLTKTVEVEGNGSTVLRIYYDRETFSVYLHSNLSPDYIWPDDEELSDLEKEIAGEDGYYPSKDDTDILWQDSGLYGSRTTKMTGMDEIRAKYEALYASSNGGETRSFLALSDIAGYDVWAQSTTIQSAFQSYHTASFYRESEIGTGELHLFPLFAKGGNSYPIHAAFFQQTLEDGRDYVRSGSASATKPSSPTTPGTSIIATADPGFTWEGGAYQIGGTLEECLGSGKIPISSSGGNSETGVSITVNGDKLTLTGPLNTFVALYMNRKNFTITYKSVTDTLDVSELGSQTAAYGATVQLLGADDVKEHTPENMQFGGWYMEADQMGTDASLTELTVPSHDVTLYAKWVPIDRSVTFFADDKEFHKAAVPHNDPVERPEAVPEKAGCYFVGWYPELPADGTEDHEGGCWDFSAPVQSDMKLYAYFRPLADASYEIRHVLEGEETPFFTEKGRGCIGGSVFAIPLSPSDAGYPTDCFVTASNPGVQTISLSSESENIITFTYTLHTSENTHKVAIYRHQSGMGKMGTNGVASNTYYLVSSDGTLSTSGASENHYNIYYDEAAGKLTIKDLQIEVEDKWLLVPGGTTIQVLGTNRIEPPEDGVYGGGICVVQDGDITITGDGSLYIKSSSAGISYGAIDNQYGGVSAVGGVTINGELQMTIDHTGASSCISVHKGDVVIGGSAEVTLNPREGSDKDNGAITYFNGGNITIQDEAKVGATGALDTTGTDENGEYGKIIVSGKSTLTITETNESGAALRGDGGIEVGEGAALTISSNNKSGQGIIASEGAIQIAGTAKIEMTNPAPAGSAALSAKSYEITGKATVTGGTTAFNITGGGTAVLNGAEVNVSGCIIGFQGKVDITNSLLEIDTKARAFNSSVTASLTDDYEVYSGASSENTTLYPVENSSVSSSAWFSPYTRICYAAKILAAPERVTFDALISGYEELPDAVTVTIENTGLKKVEGISVALSKEGQTAFTLNTENTASSLGVEESTTVTVQPKTGLASGRYEAVLQVTYDGTKTLQIPVAIDVVPARPEAIFTATGESGGTLSNVTGDMKYSVDGGQTWHAISETSVNLTGVSATNGIQVYEQGKNTDDSEIQIITVAQAQAPSGISGIACTTLQQNDGQITGVDATMEYKLSSDSEWQPITGDIVTGLVNGTYDVRVKASGTTLASKTQQVEVGAHVCAGVGNWQFDEEYHWKLCKCGAEVDREAHSGGNPTCTEDAFCEICGESYGGVLGHDWGEPEWNWSDNGKTATATFTCNRDSSHTEMLEADVTSAVKIPATCTEVGTTSYTAKVTFNGQEYTNFKDVEDIDPLGHDMQKTGRVEPTCTTDGKEAYYTCKNCKKHFSDAVGQNVIEDLEQYGVLEATGHDWSEPEWIWSDDGKTATVTFTCTRDSSHTEAPKVTVTSAVKPPATCTEKGTTTYTATVEFEGKTYMSTEDVTDIPAAGHGETETVNAKEATCTAEGYTGDKVCKVCGEVVEAGKTIAKTAHTFKDGKCTVCGAADPDYVPATPEKPDSGSPQTGDNSNIALWLGLLIVSMSGVVGTTAYVRKRRYNR